MKTSLMGHYGLQMIKEHLPWMLRFRNGPFLFLIEVAVLMEIAVARKQGYIVECDMRRETELTGHNFRRYAVALHVTKPLKSNWFF